MQITVLLEMHEHERNSYIASHKFYVEQAKKRILSQFENLDDEIEAIAQQIYDDSGKWCGPDDDPSYYAERAYELAQEHLMMLSEMREQTLFSIIAGMFHQFDKTLRAWVERESKWWAGPIVKEQFWKLDINTLYKLFISLGWNIKDESFFKALDACQIVVNIYKHGKGRALKELRLNYPEYFFDYNDPSFKVDDWHDYDSVRVSDEQFQEMSDAIVSFWKKLPPKILDSEEIKAPQWLADALAAEAKLNNS